jgi:hypothetical protein
MWGQVTAEELQQVKDQIRHSRAAMLLRHAQELSALDADEIDIDRLTGLLEGFAQKYRGSPPVQEPIASQQNTDPEAVPEDEARDVTVLNNFRQAMQGR